jgi:hypothetical protein
MALTSSLHGVYLSACGLGRARPLGGADLTRTPRLQMMGPAMLPDSDSPRGKRSGIEDVEGWRQSLFLALGALGLALLSLLVGVS